jgi:drug/metabolite transporter (DMT)-like permease
VVYPVVRGSAPLFAMIGAWVVFDKGFTPVQWLGVGVLLSGIFGMAADNLARLQTGRETLRPALALAVATGFLVALYTTWDAYGIRAPADPFTFLAWFFQIDGLAMPVLRWRHMARRPAPGPLALRRVAGGLIALASFGSIMLATRLGDVGGAAVLRETSTVFAALIGWLVLKETVGPRRLGLMALIAVGAVVVEVGGRMA